MFEMLDWDSAFFGFKVARIIPPSLAADKLAGVLTQLRQQQVTLAYWFSVDDDSSRKVAAEHDGFFVGTRVTYTSALNPTPPSSAAEAITSYQAADVVPELASLALAAGEYSRFRVDPQFPAEKFKALYATWLRRSVQKEIADDILVWKDPEGKIGGMVTVGQKEGRGDIGLIAVAPEFRGHHVGQDLLEAAQLSLVGRGLRLVQVVTQGENISACRLYEKCGYQREKTESVFHFWLNSGRD